MNVGSGLDTPNAGYMNAPVRVHESPSIGQVPSNAGYPFMLLCIQSKAHVYMDVEKLLGDENATERDDELNSQRCQRCQKGMYADKG